MSFDYPEAHGPPTFKLVGFRVWVFGRQFEEAQDYWDGNWLRVLAHCGAHGAEVRTFGAILHLREVRSWLDELLFLHASLTGSARLACIEPYLDAKVELKDGRGTFILNITPDHLTQQHKFDFEVDQSYLPELIAALENLLTEYPLRGRTNGE